MIDEAFRFLRSRLNAHLSHNAPGGGPAKVEFPGEEPSDSVRFQLDCITPLLVRIEEERLVRPDERFLRSQSETGFRTAPPAVPLYLHILFVARYKDYREGLKQLSAVIRYFQTNPVFKTGGPLPDGAEALPPSIGELKMELNTPTYTVQNEIWGALRAPYHPSALYKATLLVLEGSPPAESDKVVDELNIQMRNLHSESEPPPNPAVAAQAAAELKKRTDRVRTSEPQTDRPA